LCSRKEKEKQVRTKMRKEKPTKKVREREKERKIRQEKQAGRQGDKKKEKKEANHRPACLFTSREQFNFVI
jgi:hypothetical protein